MVQVKGTSEFWCWLVHMKGASENGTEYMIVLQHPCVGPGQQQSSFIASIVRVDGGPSELLVEGRLSEGLIDRGSSEVLVWGSACGWHWKQRKLSLKCCVKALGWAVVS